MTDLQEEEFLQGLRQEFLDQVGEQFDKCENFLLTYERAADAAQLMAFKREVHSIKGSAQAVDLKELANILHNFESKLDLAIKANRTKEFVDFSLPFLDELKASTPNLNAADTRAAAIRALTASLARFG